MTVDSPGGDSIAKIVAEMHPPRYTVSQVAKKVGRSVDTIRRWSRDGTCVPSDSAEFGKLTVRLYTDDDLESLSYLARTMRPGRKKKKAKQIINQEALHRRKIHARKTRKVPRADGSADGGRHD